MTVRVRQVGRASDPQAEMQLQELTRAVNELGGDVEGVQRTLPDVIEDIEKELDEMDPDTNRTPTIPTNLVAIPAFQMFILKWDRSVSRLWWLYCFVFHERRWYKLVRVGRNCITKHQRVHAYRA